MAAKYREYQQLNLPSIETTILEKWAKHQAFEKSIEVREGAPSFVFYEGPPSANGMTGIHHVISRTLKDFVCCYQTIKGFKGIVAGEYDHLPEQAFYMVGGIDEAVEKAKTLQ